MATNNLDKEIACRDFEYGEHTIVVSIKISNTFRGKSNDIYGPSGTGYYRTVLVKAYPTDEYNNDEIDVTYDSYNCTECRIREESIDPDITIPDNPNLSLFQKAKVLLFESTTKEDIKESIRKEKQSKLKEQRVPAGAAIELTKQVEETVRPVLETVDSQYQILEEDVTIDIDVSVERMSAEVSWADVKDEDERIAKEIENISKI